MDDVEIRIRALELAVRIVESDPDAVEILFTMATAFARFILTGEVPEEGK